MTITKLGLFVLAVAMLASFGCARHASSNVATSASAGEQGAGERPTVTIEHCSG